MKKFEIGKTYETRSICNHDCIFSYKVVKRTAKTVTIVDDKGTTKTCRINEAYTKARNTETILPLGKYSMCPTLSA